MRIAKKTTIAILLLLLVETLYLSLNDSSWSDDEGTCLTFGLPFRSVQYRLVSGEMGPAPEREWAFGFQADPSLLVIEILVGLLLVLLLIECVPAYVLMAIVQGCVLGIVTGGIFFALDATLPEPWVSVIMLIVMLVFVPITVYALSLKHRRQKTIILMISCATVIAFLRSFWVIEGISDEMMEDFSFNLRAILRFLATFVVFSGDCFLVMLLHRKVLPLFLSKKHSNESPDTAALPVVPEPPDPPAQTHKKINVKRVILYALLLAIALYTGYHFDTIRKMRSDEGWLLFDAVSATLKRLEVPQSRQYSFYMEKGSESLKGKWNVSIPAEIHLDDGHVYHVLIKKRFFVPWIQVEIDQTDAG